MMATGHVGMKRKWKVFFDGDRTHPWVVRPETGSEAFFATVEGLIRFLGEGGLRSSGIGNVVKELKEGRTASVELEDPWSK